jgi:hypothetical protein
MCASRGDDDGVRGPESIHRPELGSFQQDWACEASRKVGIGTRRNFALIYVPLVLLYTS